VTWVPLQTAAAASSLPPLLLLFRAISGDFPAHYLAHTVWIHYPSLLAKIYRPGRPTYSGPRRSSAPTPETLDRLLKAIAQFSDS